MTPEAAYIEALEHRLAAERRYATALEARLKVLDADMPRTRPDWGWSLTPTQGALMETLLRAYPRVVTRGVLEDSILRRDHAAEHRSSKSVEVHLSNLRKKLGRGVVETVHGEGYRCSKAFHIQHGGAANEPH